MFLKGKLEFNFALGGEKNKGDSLTFPFLYPLKFQACASEHGQSNGQGA